MNPNLHKTELPKPSESIFLPFHLAVDEIRSLIDLGFTKLVVNIPVVFKKDSAAKLASELSSLPGLSVLEAVLLAIYLQDHFDIGEVELKDLLSPEGVVLQLANGEKVSPILVKEDFVHPVTAEVKGRDIVDAKTAEVRQEDAYIITSRVSSLVRQYFNTALRKLQEEESGLPVLPTPTLAEMKLVRELSLLQPYIHQKGVEAIFQFPSLGFSSVEGIDPIPIRVAKLTEVLSITHESEGRFLSQADPNDDKRIVQAKKNGTLIEYTDNLKNAKSMFIDLLRQILKETKAYNDLAVTDPLKGDFVPVNIIAPGVAAMNNEVVRLPFSWTDPIGVLIKDLYKNYDVFMNLEHSPVDLQRNEGQLLFNLLKLFMYLTYVYPTLIKEYKDKVVDMGEVELRARSVMDDLENKGVLKKIIKLNSGMPLPSAITECVLNRAKVVFALDGRFPLEVLMAKYLIGDFVKTR